MTWQSSAFILELKWLRPRFIWCKYRDSLLLRYLDLSLAFFYLQWLLTQEIWVKRQISAVGEVSEAACCTCGGRVLGGGSPWAVVAPEWAVVPLCSQLLFLPVTSPRPGAPISPSPNPFLEGSGVWHLQRAFSGKEGVGSCNSGSLWLLGTVKSCLPMEPHTSWVGRAYRIEEPVPEKHMRTDITKLVQVKSTVSVGGRGDVSAI